jgi:Planctomycete cytochrome C
MRAGILVCLLTVLGSISLSFRSERIFLADPIEGDGDSLICFESEILPLLKSHCARSGCHDAVSHKGNVVLDSYKNSLMSKDGRAFVPFFPTKSKALKYIKGHEGEIMPPPPNKPLSKDQIDLIEKWINEGAQNTRRSASSISLDCDTLSVTFSNAIVPIIETNCLGCHSGSEPFAGFALETYEEVTIKAKSGHLLGAVKHLEGYEKMPLWAEKLSDCDILKIESWIDKGLPE